MSGYHGFAVIGTPAVGRIPVFQANGSVAWEDPVIPSVDAVSAEAHALAESANFFDTSPNVNFKAVTGNQFGQTVAHADWTLTPAGCIFTYNGAPGGRFLIVATMTVYPLANAIIYHEGNIGIDVGGDLIGTSCAANITSGCNNFFWPAGDQQYKTFTAQRDVSMNPAGTVQPCFGIETTGPATDVDIVRLTFSIFGISG